METLLLYLVKSSALLALFWIAYHFLLRGETFFRSNRWFLLAGLATSVLLPLVTFEKIVWVERDGTAFFPMDVAAASPSAPDFDWASLSLVIYGIGIVLMLAKFTNDFRALRRAINGRKVLRQSDFRLVDTPEHVAPFSYFKYIVYNSSLYDERDLRNILAHEKVHSRQMHSLDMLAARVCCVLFWFNPFAWLYKKSVLQNLEFIADSEAIRAVADRRSYQLTMLKVTAHQQNVDISNQFFQSLIKKRIVMLNKNQSNLWQSWKYLAIFPVLAAFLLQFQVRVVAQEKEQGMVNEALAGAQSGVQMVIDKNSSDAQLKEEAAMLKKQHGVTLKFSKVKRNSNGEITSIKAEFKDKNGKSGVTHVSSDDPISPISFYKNEDGSIGFGTNGRHVWRGAEDVAFVYRHADAPPAPGAPDFPAAPGHPRLAGVPEPPVPGRAYRTGEDRHVIIRKDKDGKSTVTINGEVVADTDKILKELEPLQEGFAYKFSEDGDVMVNREEIRRFSREAAKNAREQLRNLRPDLEKMEIELRKIGPEIERMKWRSGEDQGMAREEMEKARKEMEAARSEMLKARDEMMKAREELEKAKK